MFPTQPAGFSFSTYNTKSNVMSIFFKDIGKKAKDLLGKNYTTGEKKEFSIKTKTADGITYAAESTITGAKVKGKVKVDFKASDNVKFKTLSLDSSGCFESDVAVSNILDNVVFTLRLVWVCNCLVDIFRILSYII